LRSYWRVFQVVDRGEGGEGHCTSQRHNPDRGYDARRPPQSRHGVRVQRVANGQVALRGERHDRQHRRIGRAAEYNFIVLLTENCPYFDLEGAL